MSAFGCQARAKVKKFGGSKRHIYEEDNGTQYFERFAASR